MELASKIKEARESKRFSQEYLANVLGISQSTYSRIESGFIKPDLKKIKLIATYLGVNPFDLLGKSE